LVDIYADGVVNIVMDASGDGNGNATVGGICLSQAIELNHTLLIPVTNAGAPLSSPTAGVDAAARP
jgi:hypothetical protein